MPNERARLKAPKPVTGSRRNFLRWGAGLTLGSLLLRAGHSASVAEEPLDSVRISVLDACTGCTGCASICPTDAIAVAPGGIAVDEMRCIGCGYCAAVCPARAIRVNRGGLR